MQLRVKQDLFAHAISQQPRERRSPPHPAKQDESAPEEAAGRKSTETFAANLGRDDYKRGESAKHDTARTQQPRCPKKTGISVWFLPLPQYLLACSAF